MSSKDELLTLKEALEINNLETPPNKNGCESDNELIMEDNETVVFNKSRKKSDCDEVKFQKF